MIKQGIYNSERSIKSEIKTSNKKRKQCHYSLSVKHNSDVSKTKSKGESLQSLLNKKPVKHFEKVVERPEVEEVIITNENEEVNNQILNVKAVAPETKTTPPLERESATK